MTTPNDSVFKWSQEAHSAATVVESLYGDSKSIEHQIDDLLHTVKDLSTVRFYNLPDQDVVNKANDLFQLVSNECAKLKRSMQDVSNDINDLRRAVDFYRR